MQRRDFVKAIVAAGVSAKAALGQEPAPKPQSPAPTPTSPPTLKPSVSPNAPVAPAPIPMMRGLQEVKGLPILPLSADAIAESEQRFFNVAQIATLRRLADLFEPAYEGHPGASEANVAEFLDFLIGVSPADRQQMYVSGLDRLDKEAHGRFSSPFAKLTDDQADQLIKPWLRPWMSDHPPTEPYERFMNIAHLDIRTATVNSQATADVARKAGLQPPTVDLFWYPVDPDLKHEAAEPAHGRNGRHRLI